MNLNSQWLWLLTTALQNIAHIRAKSSWLVISCLVNSQKCADWDDVLIRLDISLPVKYGPWSKNMSCSISLYTRINICICIRKFRSWWNSRKHVTWLYLRYIGQCIEYGMNDLSAKWAPLWASGGPRHVIRRGFLSDSQFDYDELIVYIQFNVLFWAYMETFVGVHITIFAEFDF